MNVDQVATIIAALFAGVIPAAIAWGAMSARIRALEEQKAGELALKIAGLEPRLFSLEKALDRVDRESGPFGRLPRTNPGGE